MNETLNEELGKKLYELESRNWPSPIGWALLSEDSRFLWTERALKKHGLSLQREEKPLVKEIGNDNN